MSVYHHGTQLFKDHFITTMLQAIDYFYKFPMLVANSNYLAIPVCYPASMLTQPVAPWSMTSLGPGQANAATGVPQAIKCIA
jgi:hypothetical protein